MGGGHIYRCATLAGWFRGRGWKTTLVTVAETNTVVPTLSETFDDVRILPTVSLADPTMLGVTCADIVVIDHYHLDHTFETACRPFAPVVAVVDDLADRLHDCDLIVNQNAGRHSDDYALLGVKPIRHILAGADYALLRPSFAQARSASLGRERSRLHHVVVAMGATDPDGLTLTAVSALQKSASVNRIDIVIGSACPHLDAIRALASPNCALVVHVDADPARLYAKADIAVGTAGVGALERCCLGVPSLTLVAAENQQQAADYLHDSGATVTVSGNEKTRHDEMAGLLAALSNAPEELALMSEKAARICDGSGTGRVGEALVALVGTASA